jgi:hypothetical protein
MTNYPAEIQRPDCFEFAMNFLGDPEATELLKYIEALEARAALTKEQFTASSQFIEKDDDQI